MFAPSCGYKGDCKLLQLIWSLIFLLLYDVLVKFTKFPTYWRAINPYIVINSINILVYIHIKQEVIFFNVQDTIYLLLLNIELNSIFEHILFTFLYINYMNHEITSFLIQKQK